jgi:hypothetical protein
MRNLILYPDTSQNVIHAATLKEPVILQIKHQRTETAKDSLVVTFPQN